MKFYVDPQAFGGSEKAEQLAKAAEQRFPTVRFAIGPTRQTKTAGNEGLAADITAFLELAATNPDVLDELPTVTTGVPAGESISLTEAVAEAAAAPPRPPIRFPRSTPLEAPAGGQKTPAADEAQKGMPGAATEGTAPPAADEAQKGMPGAATEGTAPPADEAQKAST